MHGRIDQSVRDLPILVALLGLPATEQFDVAVLDSDANQCGCISVPPDAPMGAVESEANGVAIFEWLRCIEASGPLFGGNPRIIGGCLLIQPVATAIGG